MRDALNGPPRVSVVTPTLFRPAEITGLLDNLAEQTLLPAEVVLVDGAPAEDTATAEIVAARAASLPFPVRYIRHGRGTAVQRNAGIDIAKGNLVAFVDDDIRLAPAFLQTVAGVFAGDEPREVGGVVGYRENQHFRLEETLRWRWFHRLGLLTTYEPGRYDFKCGYPINANMQVPFTGVREVDFMTTSCAVWRREVLDAGLRFDPFFRDYGVLEDAHFSLRARRRWRLLQCGDARCVHLASPNGREDRRRIGYKCVVNYYYVFQDVAGPLTWRHKLRFWRFQAFELLRIAASAIGRRRRSDLTELRGRLEGFVAVARGGGAAG
ncbi:MAG: glycosyltransferase family 2 protein [Thermoanaerobaculia bacterium]